MQDANKRIAVTIPCHNEEAAVGKVIDDFKEQLPEAAIYVIDNCCTDATAEIARQHGAVVISEPRKGKGYAVERIFSEVDADYYVMADGDDTYSAEHVNELLTPVLQGRADMSVGARLNEYTHEAFRPLHVMGNKLVRRLVNWIGRSQLTDILSGYRAFNRRVVQRIPIVTSGFEVETEMTIQMLYYRLKIVEVPVPYRERPEGSVSKLNTFRDGFRVLWRIFSLFRSFKPLTFFGSLGLVFMALALWAGFYPIHDYLADPQHYVHHVPLAILATGLAICAAGFVFLGMILHVMNWHLMQLHNVATRRKG
jgi:glycosyltransferase involved in cell wall biosynthesis